MSTLREKRKKERAARRRRMAVDWTVVLVLAGIAAACIGYLVFYNWRLHQKEDQYEKLRPTEETEQILEAVVPEAETETETEIVDTTLYCEPVYDFDELHQQNEDIYAWITAPETQVDYPVLQSAEDNYYLNRNLDHSSGYPGCVYTNKCNAKDFSDYITVLYGHNMKNGSMFGSIHKFEKEEFFDANREIVVYTEEKRLTYDIYASVKFSDVYIPAAYDPLTTTGRDNFVKDVQDFVAGSDVSHIREDVEIGEEDKLIVLSTCVNGERPKRYLVVGKLVEEAFYDKEALETLGQDAE